MKSKFVFFIIIFTLFPHQYSYCQISIGILSNNNNCRVKIIRNNSDVKITLNTIPLYQNDMVVSKELNKMKFIWAPYAYGKTKNDSTLEVTIVSTTKIKGLMSRIGETIANYLGFIKEDFNATAVAQRGNELLELPDSSIVSVDFLPIKFTCPYGQSFSIFDNNNKEIFTNNLNGKNYIEVIPKEIKLKTDCVYSWKIMNDKEGREGKIRILNKNYQTAIHSALAVVDKLTKEPTERIIKKASYMQMISDIYENDLDLYWLSFQMIENIDFSKYPEAQFIETRYYQHLSKN